MTHHPWTEVQALGVEAASGAGVPPAQALAFGAMLARYLADGGTEGPIAAALETPQAIVALALRVERVIEAASMGITPVKVIEDDIGQRAMLVSWLSGLPCEADLKINGNTIQASLTLSAPSQRGRPEHVPLSPMLESQLQSLAAKAHGADGDPQGTGGRSTDQPD